MASLDSQSGFRLALKEEETFHSIEVTKRLYKLIEVSLSLSLEVGSDPRLIELRQASATC